MEKKIERETRLKADQKKMIKNEVEREGGGGEGEFEKEEVKKKKCCDPRPKKVLREDCAEVEEGKMKRTKGGVSE